MADVMKMATLSPTFHPQQEVLQTAFLLAQLQVEWQITSTAKWTEWSQDGLKLTKVGSTQKDPQK